MRRLLERLNPLNYVLLNNALSYLKLCEYFHVHEDLNAFNAFVKRSMESGTPLDYRYTDNGLVVQMCEDSNEIENCKVTKHLIKNFNGSEIDTIHQKTISNSRNKKKSVNFGHYPKFF